MKKCCAWLLTMLLACALLPSLTFAQAETGASPTLTPPDQLVDAQGQVIFSDALVETAIREALGGPEGPLTAKQLARLGTKNEQLNITAPSPVTLDLSVLQLCGKLKRLYLDGITPADNGAISSLANLQYLLIKEANISDFTFLSGCKNLMDLWIGSCPCHDVSFVSTLPKLRNFHIDTYVPDLTPLYAKKKLISVSIGSASDAEVNELLDQMGKRLFYLGLKSCTLEDATLERIAAMNLRDLLIGGAPVNNLALLWKSKSLESLEMFNLPVESLEGIQNMKRLKVLDLEQIIGIVNLTPVYAMPQLKQLRLYDVTLSTLSGVEGLKALTNLTFVKVRGITDYTPLAGLTRLKVLDTDIPEKMPEGMPVQ